MKKLFIIISLVFGAFFWQSCTKTCTCIPDKGNPTEIEIDPSESCSIYSNAERGKCS